MTHTYHETGVMRYKTPTRKERNPIMSLLGMPFSIIIGALRGLLSGLLGMLAMLTNWRGRDRHSTATELIEVAEAESERLWQRVQALQAELVDKEQQVKILRTANTVYAREKIPNLMKEVKDRDDLIRDYCEADTQGNMDVLLDLHNKLAERDQTIELLTNSQTSKRGAMENLEARLRHRETELMQARQELLDRSQDNMHLLRQVEEKDNLIMSISVGEGSSSETEVLRKQIWEKTKTIESLMRGIGLPPHDEQMQMLQKQVADQEYLISSLRRRLEYSGSGAQAMEVLFFPDDRARTNLHRLIGFINGATRSLDVCVPTITCIDLADAMVAAHQRGVAVRVILDDTQSQTKASHMKRISSAGVPVKMDNSRSHMHHRFCIIDENLLGNGSFNWTHQAVRYSRENLIIYDDSQLVNAFLDEFAKLWNELQ